MRYTVHSPIKVNGTIVRSGEIELADDVALSLVRQGLVSPVVGEPVLAQTGTVKAPAKKSRKAS